MADDRFNYCSTAFAAIVNTTLIMVTAMQITAFGLMTSK